MVQMLVVEKLVFCMGPKDTSLSQFLMELLMIACISFIIWFSSFFTEKVGKTVLSNILEGINGLNDKESLAGNLGGRGWSRNFSELDSDSYDSPNLKPALW